MKKIFLIVAWILVVGTSGCPKFQDKREGRPQDPHPTLPIENCDRFEQYKQLLASQGDRAAPPDHRYVMNAAGPAMPVGDEAGGASPVSEADFVQVDESTLYRVERNQEDWNDGQISSFQIDPEGKISPIGSLKFSGDPVEFLLSRPLALVITTSSSKEDGYGLFLHLVDLGDPTAPRLIRSLFIEGANYVTSRLVGRTAHLVMSRRINTWGPAEDKILPVYQESGAEGGLLGSCGATFIPKEMLEEDLWDSAVLSVVSLPLDESSFTPRASAVLFEGGTPVVSVNSDAIYIGSETADRSHIFKFDLTADPTQAVYVAQGEVPGRLTTAFTTGGYNDQFSMDEYRGNLRVATTSGELSRDGNSSAVSSLFILHQEGDQLKTVGSLKDLDHGEAIYGIRFFGERGYVVTFKKVDPLFVVDLSDPAQPLLQGKIDLPGFSTYLMPIDDRMVFAIGKDADDQGTFAWYGGVKISLFDVREPSDPRLIDSKTIGERGTSSEALSDRRALGYFPDRGLVAFPVDLVTEAPKDGPSGWRSVGSPDHSEEEIWRITPQGFSLDGTIRHPLEDRLRRALEVNGKLVTLSEREMATYDFEDLLEISSIDFR